MARRVAYVPQLHQIPFAYTALEMVLMGRAGRASFFGRPSNRDRDIALAALKRFSIGHLAHVPVTRLSGGQRQLTMLARALAQEAAALVLDEPINGLDFGHQAQFLGILQELCAEGRTCVMSTHFPDHALWVADHVLLLRDGQMVADGPPREVVTRENLSRLYDADISVFSMSEAIRVCIPDRISRNRPERLPSGAAARPANPDARRRPKEQPYG
jgi:iron complex transport system ATP-binding protein